MVLQTAIDLSCDLVLQPFPLAVLGVGFALKHLVAFDALVVRHGVPTPAITLPR